MGKSINDGAFINFTLMKKLRRAIKAGVIRHEIKKDDEYEEPHLSKLERMVKAMDEAEIFIITHTLIYEHGPLFIRILKYLQKEGESHV